MTELISIKDSSKHVDQEVKMHVWLTDKRSSGKIIFLQLRDGTAFFQGVIRKNDVSEEVFEAAKSLRQEASFTSLVLFTKISVHTLAMKFKFQI